MINRSFKFQGFGGLLIASTLIMPNTAQAQESKRPLYSKKLSDSLKPLSANSLTSFIKDYDKKHKPQVFMFGFPHRMVKFYRLANKEQLAKNLKSLGVTTLLVEQQPKLFFKTFDLNRQQAYEKWAKSKNPKAPSYIANAFREPAKDEAKDKKKQLLKLLGSFNEQGIKIVCCDYRALVKHLNEVHAGKAKLNRDKYLKGLDPIFHKATDMAIKELERQKKAKVIEPQITRDFFMAAIAELHLAKGEKIASFSGRHHGEEGEGYVPHMPQFKKADGKFHKVNETQPLGERLSKYLGKGDATKGKDKICSISICFDKPSGYTGSAGSKLRDLSAFLKNDQIQIFDLNNSKIANLLKPAFKIKNGMTLWMSKFTKGENYWVRRLFNIRNNPVADAIVVFADKKSSKD